MFGEIIEENEFTKDISASAGSRAAEMIMESLIAQFVRDDDVQAHRSCTGIDRLSETELLFRSYLTEEGLNYMIVVPIVQDGEKFFLKRFFKFGLSIEKAA